MRKGLSCFDSCLLRRLERRRTNVASGAALWCFPNCRPGGSVFPPQRRHESTRTPSQQSSKAETTSPRGQRGAYKRNKSQGRRPEIIPWKATDKSLERVCGLHVILNILRVFALGVHPHVTRNGAGPASNRSASFRHPHRERLSCLYVRDFSLEGEEREGAAGLSRQRVVPGKYPALHRVMALAKAIQASLEITATSEGSSSDATPFHIQFVPRRELLELSRGDRRNQNAVLEVSPFQPRRVVSLQEVWDDVSASCADSPTRWVTVLYLDKILDPVNVGGILRTAYFYGVNHVLLSPDTAPCSPATARSSVGLMEHLHVYRLSGVTHTSAALSLLTGAHQWMAGHSSNPRRPPLLEVIGTTVSPPKQPVAHPPLQAPVTKEEKEKEMGEVHLRLVLLGNEREGLPNAVLQHCSRIIHLAAPRHAILQSNGHTAANLSEDLVGETLDHTFATLPRPLRFTALRAARIRSGEVSLNVHAACAALLSELLKESR